MAEGGVSLTNKNEKQASEVDKNSIPKNLKDLYEECSKDEDAVAKFLEKVKSDRMFEIRQMKLGHKPVTGKNRENIDDFFTKRIRAQEVAASHGKENVPIHTDEGEERRPERVVVEIQGLVEQRRVSDMLGTTFRRQLENLIRGSISRATNRTFLAQPRTSAAGSSPTNNRSASPRPVPSPRHSLRRSSLSSETGSRGEAEQLVHPLIERLRTDSISSISSASTNPTSIAERSSELWERASSSSTTSNTRHASPTLEEQQVPSPIPQRYEQLIGYDFQSVQRDSMVQEISELVSNRLVTSALGGGFRNTMEQHVQDHLSRIDADGRRVQEFIRNLHPTQHIERNDFSHLGIHVLPEPENLDNISVASFSATASVPYAQSNLHLKHEIQGLKAQLMEMKNMMKLSFELQMDIQRSIRQEVAAAMHMEKYKDGTQALPGTTRSRPVNDTHCLICLDSHADSVMYRCGHMCVCFSCGRTLMERKAHCPVCRAPILDVIRAFKSNIE